MRTITNLVSINERWIGMYTGLVETTGEIKAINHFESGCRLCIGVDTTDIDSDDSISISGVCLTVESVTDDGFVAFLSEETVTRTYLSDLAPGDQVNIERPLLIDDRFNGHVVKGTVDTIAEIIEIEELGEDWRFTFSVPRDYKQYFVEKGAVALDGISLTVTDITHETFSVAVVPTTYNLTTLSEKIVGDSIHVETDILAKYVERQRKFEA